MGEAIPSKLCGRPFDRSDLEKIRAEIVWANPPLRAEIARRACRTLEWIDAMGRPKLTSARVELLRLHRAGLIELPPSGSNGNGRALRHGPTHWPEEVPLAGSVEQLNGLRLTPSAGDLGRKTDIEHSWHPQWAGRDACRLPPVRPGARHPEAVLATHAACTQARLSEHPRVLCIEDASELDFTTKKGIAGLGPLNYQSRLGL